MIYDGGELRLECMEFSNASLDFSAFRKIVCENCVFTNCSIILPDNGMLDFWCGCVMMIGCVIQRRSREASAGRHQPRGPYPLPIDVATPA